MSESEFPRRRPRVVAIDDDPTMKVVLEEALPGEEFDLAAADNALSGLRQIERLRPDVVILDNVLPDTKGLEMLRRIREFDGQLPVILVTARDSSDLAIEAMKLGAFDYLPKPLELPRLRIQVEQALQIRRLMRVPVTLDSSGADDDPRADCLVGRSPAMQEAYKAIGRMAARDTPALIYGEPGTGKELVARAIFQHSPRSGKPFLRVNCREHGEEELEIELFGGEPLAGQPLREARLGKLEQCDGGALLIEEVDAAPLSIQGKLLRAARGQGFTRAGGSQVRRADVRIIATAQRDLRRLVEQGRVRVDFCYLLNAFAIHLPPLRERTEDLPLLVDHFVRRLSRISRSFAEAPTRVAVDALAILQAHDWPGNLDELQGVLERALVESKGAVLASEFLRRALSRSAPPRASQAPSQPCDAFATNWRALVDSLLAEGSEDIYEQALIEMERHVLALVMRHTGNNQVQAARLLGISRGSLRKKLRILKRGEESASEDLLHEQD